jgi:predicted dehydrogenase
MTKTTRRKFLGQSMLAAAATTVPWFAGCAQTRAVRAPRQYGPGDRVRVGVIGVRGRGRGHIGAFKSSPDAEVVAICDPDEAVVGPALSAVPKAVWHRDIRRMLDDPGIDAVSIATPNHWHSLAAIWALQAGKHVYVEKPISHNLHEGRQVVAAAKQYGGVLQHGTQARSHVATRDAMSWLHAGGLGRVSLARGLCYKRRGSIGKVDGPQQPPESLDYDLWTGPAEKQDLLRKNLHYDWHWIYNTGNGDIGNQGVHQLDIARWGLGVSGHPKVVSSFGGRLGYDDDGNTANTQVCLYDYGDKQMIFEVRGLQTGAYRSAHVGVVFHGERGYLVSASYTKLTAYHPDGSVMKVFEGGGNHFQAFLDAVKAGRPAAVPADAREGHLSAALAHLGNIAYRIGDERRLSELEAPFGASEAGNESFARSLQHLHDNNLDPSETVIRISPALTFDAATERFVGEKAKAANALLRREPREHFSIPELTA